MSSEYSAKLASLLYFLTAPAAAQTRGFRLRVHQIRGAVRDAATGEPIAPLTAEHFTGHRDGSSYGYPATP
jgi:hypothetical protein